MARPFQVLAKVPNAGNEVVRVTLVAVWRINKRRQRPDWGALGQVVAIEVSLAPWVLKGQS